MELRKWLGLLIFVDNCSTVMNPIFMHLGHVQPNPTWMTTNHSHRFHELILVLDGVLHVDIGGQTFHAGAGEMLWYPAGVAHRENADPQQPCETLFLGIEWDAAPSDWPLWQADRDGRVAPIVQWLKAERESHYTGRVAWRNTMLAGVLAEYDRLARYQEDPLVVNLRSYVRKHLAEALTLDQLAKLAGLSKFHLVRRYRVLTGRTPMEDVRHIRLQAARELLLTTNLPLKEIAPRTGLGDLYRLCRLFHRHFRVTPGSLRKR
jgi:AraC family transcriptional regulator of arabinose operon